MNINNIYMNLNWIYMDANRVVYQLMFQLNLVLLLVYNFTVAIVCHLHIQMNMALLMEMLKIKILKLCQSSNYAVSQCMQRILVKKGWVPDLHRPKQCFVFIWNELCSLHYTSSPVNAANDILILNICKSSS